MRLGNSTTSIAYNASSQWARDTQRIGSVPAAGFVFPVRCSIAAGLLLGLSISAQSPRVPAISQAEDGQIYSRVPEQQPMDSTAPAMDHKRTAALNRLRQKAIIDDTTRLLVLARELNAQASTMSSAERVHKAAEIEKLARNVKEKMSYAVGGNPSASSSYTVFP